MTEQTRTDESLGTVVRAAGLIGIQFESPIRWSTDDGSVARREAARACRRQALLLWPRLDPYLLARTRGDPWRIARLVARRTPRPLDEIVAMLTISTPACPIIPGQSGRAASPAARLVSRG
jgi:hypothetical protein